MPDAIKPLIANREDTPEIERLIGEHWGGRFKPLTPGMREHGGNLGVNLMRVPPGRACVPFHLHQREDEVFYILSGHGLFRYGEALAEVKVGDCISCPAGTGIAHQLANTSADVDLTYLAIGARDPDEICVYPDTGKVMVRSIGRIGKLEETEYMAGEPDRPKIYDLAED